RRRRAELAQYVVSVLLIAAVLAGLAYYLEKTLHWVKSGAGRAWAADFSIPFTSIEFSLGWAVQPALAEFFLAAALLLASAGVGWAVHVNRYSLHAMYRDRLIRTFLAATRRRRPVPPEIQAAMPTGTAPPAGRLR